MSSKKYRINIEQSGETWTAQIVRQVSKLKMHVSKEQCGFADESDAQIWADSALTEYIGTQKKANARQAAQRKQSEEIKRERSSRRAEKTKAAKEAQKQAELDQAMVENDTPSTSD